MRGVSEKRLSVVSGEHAGGGMGFAARWNTAPTSSSPCNPTNTTEEEVRAFDCFTYVQQQAWQQSAHTYLRVNEDVFRHLDENTHGKWQ